MIIDGVVFQALKGLVDNRCYPNTFPQGQLPVWPAIRYTLVSADPGPTVCGTDEGDADEYRVQIDCVDKSYGGAASLRDQVIATMQTVDPPTTRDTIFEDYDSETKTHRATVDYLLHPST